MRDTVMRRDGVEAHRGASRHIKARRVGARRGVERRVEAHRGIDGGFILYATSHFAPPLNGIEASSLDVEASRPGLRAAPGEREPSGGRRSAQGNDILPCTISRFS